MTTPHSPADETRTAPGANDYDAVPYPNMTYAQTHPDVMATLATLLGMQPAPVTHCRVLEIGAAAGANLIPMADALPGSEFVGIDYSARQVKEGLALVTALGLENLSLRQMNILDVTPELGEFDYIIAHGIYSWVPADVRDRLLAVCKQNLAPQGVAYISYNTYPGWHMLGGIRQMMLYHTRGIDNPMEKIAEARKLLEFLTKALAGKNDGSVMLLKGYVNFLENELKHLNTSSDAYLLHDELETVNDPLYFHEFAAHASGHGLQYITDADFRMSLPTNFPPEVSKQLREMAGDLIEMEQYVDYLDNRTLRRSLLCHSEIQLSRTLTPARIMGMYVTSRAHAVSKEVDFNSTAVEKFKGSDGLMFSTDHPVSKAALAYVIEQNPRAVSFEELLETGRARVRNNPNERARDAAVLGANLLRAYTHSSSLIELHSYAPALVTTVSARPLATRVARFQAPSVDRITNLYHERVKLDPLGAFVVPFLDGEHDHAALLELLLAGPVLDGTLKLEQAGEPIRDPAQLHAILSDELGRLLRWLAYAAVLTG